MKLQLLIVLVILALAQHVHGTNSMVSRKRANLNQNMNKKKPTVVLETVASATASLASKSVTSGVAISSTSGQQLQPWYFSIVPIYPKELAKFFSLSFMMFWIVFVFTMTRDTKDALIVTNCGAEAIAFLKVYGVVPAAALFMIGYAKMASVLPPAALFYATIIPFFVFYAVFSFVLYPLRDVLHPLSIAVPKGGLSYAVNLLRYWTFSLYYIVSELWGSAGIPLLFWSCANDVVPIDQAKRIYPLISLIGNTGPIFSGIAMTLVSKIISKRYVGNDDKAFEVSLKILSVMMTAAGGFVAILYGVIQRIVASERAATAATAAAAAAYGTKKAVAEKKKKPELSFFESLKVLAADKYLRNIATMVISYGLTMEFTEIIWKATVKAAYPVKTDYLNFMGRYSTLVGTSSFIMMFVGAKVVDTLGWRAGALMTPGMMGLLAVPFFACITFGGTTSKSALLIAVYVGLVQNVLSKATKYAIFDPTKEMTYIPLDQEAKTKGKAAIDVLGARLGKSGGALVQQFLVVLFGSIMGGAPVISVLFYVTIFAWIAAVNELAPKFKQRSEAISEKKKQQ